MTVIGIVADVRDHAREQRRWWQASDYFATLGIPLLRGRTFATTDDSIAPRMAIMLRRIQNESCS